ncbi:MAG: insulinase family protein [Dehalococcoidia bacterium]|nr:MAG: insulinase family protein [Dehalococcoidia bacterium]
MPTKTTLNNGLRIITQKMPAVRSVTVCMLIGTGSRYERDEIAGTSHFIEHLLFRGTQRKPRARDISETIEGLGGILNGGTDKEMTIYWCKVAREHLPVAIDLLADILLNSKFETEDIKRERKVIIEEINISYDSPQQRVSQLIDELLWPGHPLGRDIAGDKQSIKAITRDDLFDYMRLQYLPIKTVVSVAGHVDHEKVVTMVNHCYGDWSTKEGFVGFAPYKKQTNPRLCIERRDIEQIHFCLALPGLSLYHPQRFTLDLLNVILGEGMSSRLFCEVRDRLGLAYSINSFVEHLSDTGAIVIYAGVEPKNLKLTLRVVLEQLIRLKNEIVNEKELIKAKEMAKGRLLLRMEDSRSVAGWFGGQEVITRKILGVNEVISIINDITAKDIQKLARELFIAKHLRLAVVGPVTENEILGDLLKL